MAPTPAGTLRPRPYLPPPRWAAAPTATTGPKPTATRSPARSPPTDLRRPELPGRQREPRRSRHGDRCVRARTRRAQLMDPSLSSLGRGPRVAALGRGGADKAERDRVLGDPHRIYQGQARRGSRVLIRRRTVVKHEAIAIRSARCACSAHLKRKSGFPSRRPHATCPRRHHRPAAKRLASKPLSARLPAATCFRAAKCLSCLGSRPRRSTTSRAAAIYPHVALADVGCPPRPARRRSRAAQRARRLAPPEPQPPARQRRSATQEA